MTRIFFKKGIEEPLGFSTKFDHFKRTLKTEELNKNNLKKIKGGTTAGIEEPLHG